MSPSLHTSAARGCPYAPATPFWRQRLTTLPTRFASDLGFAVLAAALVSCGTEEIVPEPYLPSSAHEAYSHSLGQAKLSDTGLGRDWIAAGERALAEPVDVDAPFQESGYFDAAEASAVGFQFSAEAGQRIEAWVAVDTPTPLRIFIDLYRVPAEEGTAPVHVASGPAFDPRLEFEPRRDARYTLRVQPELLRGGRYTVTLRNVASLEFPVAGLSTGAIESGFGVPRDAGRRTHRGVDIFAPRGTPVVAAAEAIVRRVGTQDRGGNVIWLSTARNGYSLYYAHLDTWSVERGQPVVPGEVIGTVGNTGNARTTRPHLHFAVYRRGRGALNPYPFLHQPRTTAEKIAVDLEHLGKWTRAAHDEISLRAAPSRRAPILRELSLHTPMRVWGGSSGYYRVRMPDGTSGYVTARLTEPAEEPIRSEALGIGRPVLDRPALNASVMEEIAAGQQLPILGSFGDFLYVQTPNGLTGWLPFD